MKYNEPSAGTQARIADLEAENACLRKAGNGLSNWAGELEKCVMENNDDPTSYGVQCAKWVRSYREKWQEACGE